MPPIRVRKTVLQPSQVLPPHVAPGQVPLATEAPFGVAYQSMFLKLVLTDQRFGRTIVSYIKPQFFQNEVMAWAWDTSARYREAYGHFPSFMFLFDAVRTVNPAFQNIYANVLQQVWNTNVVDEEWLRHQALDFIKRNIFRQAFSDAKDLFAASKFDEAYDLMQGRLDDINTADFENVDRGWLAEEYVTRNAERQATAGTDLIGTGIPQLDQLLEGGAYPGFLGTWIAYPKAGKTTYLVNLGVVAIRAYFKRVLHIVLEGKRQMVEARYDSVISNEMYSRVKRGDMDFQKYQEALKEMQYLRGLCVIRGFVDDWNASAINIVEELRSLKQIYGWEPDLIVVDYADLLRARVPTDGNETKEQIEAYKDLKSLANRGYRIWTASQAQRPKDDKWEHEPHLLTSKSIADAYGKVRVCDFIGSLNQTVQERQMKTMRLYAEMFRDGPAGLVIPVTTAFERMTIQGLATSNAANPMHGIAALKPFGYAVGTKGWQQTQNGV